MKQAVAACLLAVFAVLPSRAFAQTTSRFQPRFEVIPVETDNGAGGVAAFWRYGLGCPPPNSIPTFGCPNPFEQDPNNQGLVLAKSVPTSDPPKAIAVLKGVKGTFLVELGYDLRRIGDQNTPNGSECTLTSPRFEFQMADGSNLYIPCQLLTLDEEASTWWRRLRWLVADVAQASPAPILACPMPVKKNTTCNVPISCTNPSGCGLDKRMQSVRIVQDVGPDSDGAAMFGLSVFDNIDVNGRLKGTGPGPRNGDEDEGQGRDKDGREFYHLDSPSHPEQGKFEFHDPATNFNLVGVNGVRGIAYSVGPLGQPCVSFSGDGVVNGSAGYLYTFLSCDLSAVGTDLGTYTITVAGPLGTPPYNRTGALLMGSVEIHK